MKNCTFYIIFILFSFWSGSVFSQTNCLTDPPLPPVLTLVTVEPETGNTRFTWTPSPSPDIAAYILYSYKNGDGMPLDTLWDPTATSYTLSSTVTKYKSASYVVTAMRLPRCTSKFSNVLNSIFCSSEIDTCNNVINLKWNTYPDYPKPVLEYKIYVSVNGSPLSEMHSVDNRTTNFIFSDIATDSQYSFVVKAILEEGSASSSNKTPILSTKRQRPPLWINADQATINSDGKVALSFTIDPLSEIKHFSLERRIGPAGTFQEISQPVSVNGSIRFTDNQAEKNNINYYRLSAVNSCNLPVMVSNIASNMVLSLERSGENIILSWNPYKKWLGIISSYKLFVNTGKGYEEKADLPASDTVFVQGYQQIMYEVTGNQVCFYVSASEASNPYSISGESLSSEICTNPTEVITVPNVFTPNNDLDNDLFRPVLSFTPLDYYLIVRGRRGNVLFETRDYHAEWDGSQNGKPQPKGVYLWFLKLTTQSGRVISKTGTLTIIRNRQ